MVKEAEVDGGKADRMAEAEGGTEIPAEEPSATKVRLSRMLRVSG